jgi:hypothetical protein
MATTPPTKKSKYLQDKDYINPIPWKLNNAGTFNRLIEQGDRYDGIIEGVQNPVDSPNDPYKDENEIRITIPLIDMPEYGELVMRIVDHGASLLKEYAKIGDFINAEKSVSLKGELDIGQNGQGMAQYQKISMTQRITTRCDKTGMMYRFFIIPSTNPEFRIMYTVPEDGPIYLKEDEWNLHHEGTMVEWFDKYEGSADIDVRKAINKIREIFGWRMMEVPNMKILVNDENVELPEYLEGRPRGRAPFLGRLGNRMVSRDNIPHLVNPEVRGFAVVDKQKGRGMIVVHAKGYKVAEIHSGLNKAGTLFINCDQLAWILTANRKGFNDDKFIEDLKVHCRLWMKDIPDMKDDTIKSERKEYKSVQEITSKILTPYIEKYAKHLRIGAQKNKKESMLVNPEGKDSAGYPTYPPKPPQVLKTCAICGHKMIKSDEMREECKCKCHKANKPPVNTNVTGTENVSHDGKAEGKDNKNTNKGFSTVYVNTGPFMNFIKEIRCLNINKLDKLYKFCIKNVSHKLQSERLAPYLAEIVMELEHPNAFIEDPYEKYIEQLHGYTIDILESLGENL